MVKALPVDVSVIAILIGTETHPSSLSIKAMKLDE
jgi:hypothetical protein